MVRSLFDADGALKPERRLVERIGTGGPVLDPDHVIEYALISAAAHDRAQVVEFLLNKGPDLAVREPCFHSTALGVARYHGRQAMVDRLEPLSAGPAPA